MRCTVFKSLRRAGVYLYVEDKDSLRHIPQDLRRAIEPLEPVMELELHAGRKLARSDAATVMNELHKRGYYLQLPPGRTRL